jgi:hypothetical protein
MSRFRIWVNIEELHDANEDDVYQDCGLPDAIGDFATLEEAACFVRGLPGWRARNEGTSDYREGGGLRAPSESEVEP